MVLNLQDKMGGDLADNLYLYFTAPPILVTLSLLYLKLKYTLAFQIHMKQLWSFVKRRASSRLKQLALEKTRTVLGFKSLRNDKKALAVIV